MFPDMHQLNHRAYMWNKLKDWLLYGAIPDDENLQTELTGPGYHINQAGKLVIESKRDMADRGVASPDWADAAVADVRAASGASEASGTNASRSLKCMAITVRTERKT
jgi:hypothetical protein